jgi:DNA gyrase subunit A
MAKRTTTPPPGETPQDGVERVVDIDVEDEMRNAFLEYSVQRHLLPCPARCARRAEAGPAPDPVRMHELGLRPDRPHVKSSRVVGEVMGKYHPHGDQAIYDALVRMAQPFTMRLPLVDGHGNFGSLDDGPAASRYTEARPRPAALLMVTGLDEDTVDFVPNYDDSAPAAGRAARGLPQPAGQRRVRDRGRDGDEHGRRTTSSRSSAPPATSSPTRTAPSTT